MTGIFGALIESSIAMSVVALVYLAISSLASPIYAAKSCYYTWLIIAIGFLIPFRMHLPTPVIAVETAILGEVPLTMMNFAAISGGQAGTTGSASGNISVLTVICALWLIGAIIFLSYHLNRHRKFLRLVKRWGEDVSDVKTIVIMENVKNGLGMVKPVRLRTCTGITSPMLIGFFRPAILLGTGYIPESELPLIFEHELVHFKRRDLWYKALLLLTTSIHWFNPIVHIMAREIGMACELSCDAEVTKNADINRRRQYVESIIGVIRQQTPAQTPLCTNFYSGKQGMKKRVLSIMDGKYKKIGVLLPVLIMFCTLSTGTVFAFEHPQSVVPPEEMNQAAKVTATPVSTSEPEQPAPVITAMNANEDGKISAHKIETNNTYVYSDSTNSQWAMEQGERTTIVLELDETAPEVQASVGYVLNGKMIELYQGKIEKGVEISFTAPQNGGYRFYLENSLKAAVPIGSFYLVPEYSLIEDKGYPIIKR